jgi:hypothetical protein
MLEVMSRIRVGVALAVLGSSAACQEAAPVATTAQAVVGAELSTDDPGVVALTNDGNVFCTGTLVSPRAVLTAGHCVDMLGGNGSVFIGDFVGGEGIRATIATSQSHPGWTGDLADGNDIGMVLLDTAQDPDLAVPMSTADLSTMIDAPYRVVGFGIYDRDTRDLDGNKRTAVMRIGNIAGDYVEIYDADPTMDPDTAICQGDSGGPGFVTVDGVEAIAGVHSYSIEGCFNPSGDSRVALFLADFVQPWIDSHDPACGADGTCARVGCSNDPDCMPCGPDGTCASGCALPDYDCPTQAVGQICRADSQCMSGLCVYWDGDPRVKFCSQPCDGGCPTGMTCKNVLPFGDVCYYDANDPPGTLGSACTQPTDCAEYICENNQCTYECSIPQGRGCESGFVCEDHGMGARCYASTDEGEGGGGCSAGTRGGAGGTILLGIGLALALRRRRR